MNAKVVLVVVVVSYALLKESTILKKQEGEKK